MEDRELVPLLADDDEERVKKVQELGEVEHVQHVAHDRVLVVEGVARKRTVSL